MTCVILERCPTRPSPRVFLWGTLGQAREQRNRGVYELVKEPRHMHRMLSRGFHQNGSFLVATNKLINSLNSDMSMGLLR